MTPSLLNVILSRVRVTLDASHVADLMNTLDVHDINVCGFCGLNSCHNILIQTSKESQAKHHKIQSNCSYAEVLKRVPVFSIRNKCTNYMMKCSICKADIWTYNGEKHYQQIHSEVECPIFVGQNEKDAMLS